MYKFRQQMSDQDEGPNLQLTCLVTMTEIIEKDLIKGEGEIKGQKIKILRTYLGSRAWELVGKLGASREL